MDGDDGFVELRRHGRERELTDTIVAFTVVSRVIMKNGVATLAFANCWIIKPQASFQKFQECHALSIELRGNHLPRFRDLTPKRWFRLVGQSGLAAGFKQREMVLFQESPTYNLAR